MFSTSRFGDMMFNEEVGIDLGTANVLIYMDGKGSVLEEPLDIICEAPYGVLEKTPPELAADVGERGIVITGGGAHLRGLDRRIEERTGIKTVVADDADLCVVRGTGEALKFIDVTSRNSLNRRETYI